MLAVRLLAAGLLGCAARDEHTTLADLERANAGVRVSEERDACNCSCGSLICWNFTCSGNGCSRADEYELTVDRDPASPGAGCLDARTFVTAQLTIADAEPLAAKTDTRGCHEIGFRWRLPRGQLQSRPHRIEISDARQTWSIEQPFRVTSLAVTAPASAVSTATTQATRAGEALTLALAPAAELTDVHASLRSAVTHESIELPVDVIGETDLEVSVPSDPPPGLYAFELAAGTQLPSDACHGPAFCRGLDVATSFDLRVE